MRRFLFLIVLAGFLFIANEINADDIIATKEYFPLDHLHGYIESQGQYKWHTEFSGLTTIEDKPAYITTTMISYQDTGEKLSDKSIFTIDNDGDIYKAGSYLNNWLIKWNPKPELILKKEMELGAPYIIQDDMLGDKREVVDLTLQKLKNLKLKNLTIPCIIIQKHVHIDYPGDAWNAWDSPTASFSYEYRYYAKGIGMVEHEGVCYGCQCGNMAPSGGNITLTETRSNSGSESNE